MLLLDEPTSALDPKNQIEVMRAVRDITVHEDIATVVVMHLPKIGRASCRERV